MRTMMQILCAVQDEEITTREQARAVIDQECIEYAKVLEISEEDARVTVLANIANAMSRLCTLGQQERIADLFGLTPKENDGNEERTDTVSPL